MDFSINPEGIHRSAMELSDGLGELTNHVEQFASSFNLGDMFGDNSLLAEIGNPMYLGAVDWILQCLRSLEGALGDHAGALGAAATAFQRTEETNAAMSHQIMSSAPFAPEPFTPAPSPAPMPAHTLASEPAPAPESSPEPESNSAPESAPASTSGDGGSLPGGEITYEATPEVKQWIGEARQIMIADGIDPSLINANDLAIIAMHESGGDPNAANDWDINAQNGTPSIGLMQTIGPTFDAHAMPGHTDIHNPVDNIIAASRYAIDRYGSVSATPGPASVNSGGPYLPY